MDFQAVMQFIGTLGYPIAACCYHLYSREKDAERHKEEMDKIEVKINGFSSCDAVYRNFGFSDCGMLLSPIYPGERRSASQGRDG